MRPDSGRTPGSPKPPASSAGVNPRGSSRVPPRLGHNLVPHSRVHRSGKHGVQQGPCIALLQSFYDEVGKRGQLVTRVAGREDQADWIRCQPAGHENQGLSRGAIQPLLVI
jgi:hypothetical protein